MPYAQEKSFVFYGHLSLHDINQAHSMPLSQHILHLRVPE